jgi:zinc/manganese transport system substrate-binding protein
LPLKETPMICRRTLLASLASLAVALPAWAEDAKLPVTASFSILGDVVRNIGGERIALTILVQPGSDAHVYAPTPADAKTVGEAKVVITNGLKFESWMKSLVQSSASKAVVVEAAKGVKTRAGKEESGHNHGHSHGAADPHAWQSVPNVRIYVVNIRDALISADPAGKSAYEANTIRYLAELNALDADIRASVAKIPADRRKIITSHDAFGYFADTYGVKFIAPRGVSTEAEASAKDVAKLIQQIKREKITAVFVENISDQRLIQQIAKDTGARVGGTLFSDALSKPEGPAATYIGMMRHNVKTISDALIPNT